MPCPVIYGTTVPASFWDSLSSESIRDKTIARLIPSSVSTDQFAIA